MKNHRWGKIDQRKWKGVIEILKASLKILKMLHSQFKNMKKVEFLQIGFLKIK